MYRYLIGTLHFACNINKTENTVLYLWYVPYRLGTGMLPATATQYRRYGIKPSKHQQQNRRRTVPVPGTELERTVPTKGNDKVQILDTLHPLASTLSVLYLGI
jgi:hypothetical protein